MNVKPVCCQRSVLIDTLIWITCNTISFSHEFRTFSNDITHWFLNMLHLVDFLYSQNFILQNTWQFSWLICVVSRGYDNFHNLETILVCFGKFVLEMNMLGHKSLGCIIICSCFMVCLCSSGYCWLVERTGLIREMHCHQSCVPFFSHSLTLLLCSQASFVFRAFFGRKHNGRKLISFISLL